MNPISHTALVLLCCLASPIAEATTPDELRLLGSDREEAQYQSYLPFTRSLAASGVVQGSLGASTAEAGVPPAAMVEALDALATAIDLRRDVHDGDRFYVRYERTFTAEGNAVGVDRVLWAELRTQAKGTIAIHRFRPLKANTDSFWLSTGQAATPAALKLPLDTITVSSGFGMRADPFDQPFRGGQPFRSAAAPAGKIAKSASNGAAKGAVNGRGGPPIQPSPRKKSSWRIVVPTIKPQLHA